MPKVFVSYRRDDSAFPAQVIYRKLAEQFGAESVMFDVDTIPVGVDFVEYLSQQVSECDVLLAVIGDSWLDVRAADGSRRIDNPNDFVRIEIHAALQRNILVVPVLVEEASMPSATQLPPQLKPLSRRNATKVRAGRDFETDLERLVRGIEKSLQHAALSSKQDKQRDVQPESRKPHEAQQANESSSSTEEVKAESETRDQTERPTKEVSKPYWTRGQWWRLAAVVAATSVIGLMIYGGIKLLNWPTLGDGTTDSDSSEQTEMGATVDSEDSKLVDIPGFVWIEPGDFIMGSREDEPSRREYETQHRVVLTEGFYIGECEVTQAEYLEVMQGENPSRFKGADLPVSNVDWYQAMDFCRQLTERDHKSGKLPQGFEYTLPSEAQWEYACRAGSEGAYCFGDNESQMDDYAWFNTNSGNKTHPVGEKQPNAWGLYDMHGNVLEWCRDRYGEYYYRASLVEDPTGHSEDSRRVIRGGGWDLSARYCRSAYRNRSVPLYRYFNLGFRVVAVPAGKTSQ